jgi:hypothetical protein
MIPTYKLEHAPFANDSRSPVTRLITGVEAVMYNGPPNERKISVGQGPNYKLNVFRTDTAHLRIESANSKREVAFYYSH